MEMHQARYFVALCETLNFTRAADKCNVTQPSLTRAIKLLEEELGGPLFNRERNQTHLTELGRMMEPHLREVIEQAKISAGRASELFRVEERRGSNWGWRAESRFTSSTTRCAALSPAYPDTEIALHDDRPSDCAKRCVAVISRGTSCRSARKTWMTCTTIRSARTVSG